MPEDSPSTEPKNVFPPEPEASGELESSEQPQPEKAPTVESIVEKWGKPYLSPTQEDIVEIPSLKPRIDYLDIGNKWLGRLGPVLLLVFAFFYYQQYYLSGLNLGGEGGTNAVTAMRLIEGQRPIADVFLGYNVMWFYPLVWLFQVVGPDFTAMRIFFYVLSAVTAVLAFATVRRVTKQAWLALGCGVLVVLLPGMLFRNYMSLLAVLNVFVLVNAFVFESATPVRRFGWYVAAGLALGLTFLTRIDMGVFFTPIYFGAAVFWPWAVRRKFWSRIPETIAAMLTVVLVATVLHIPFWLDSRTRGFEENFVGQYKGIWGLIQYEAKKQIFDKITPPAARMPLPETDVSEWIRVRSDAPAVAPATDASGGDAGGTRPRPSVEAIFGDASFYDKCFVIALYLPVVIAGIILIFSAGGLLVGIFGVVENLKRDALAAGVTLGGALTLFPQYFFFRPDTPHLAEFRIPFLVAMICACFLAVRWLWSRSAVIKLGVLGFIILCGICEGAFFYHAYYKDSSGSVRVMHNRTAEFVAENGVRAMIKKRDVDWMNGLRDSILKHSDPTDWVVTYPYSPTINFMTNRRSYLYNLYVDNVTAPRNFHEITVQQIREFRPAIVVVDDRPINNTDISRFSQWARQTVEFLRREYVQIGEFNSLSVFARPDKAPKKSPASVMEAP